MKETKRFKRVAKPTLAIPATDSKGDHPLGKPRRTKSMTLKVKLEPGPKSRLDTSSISELSLGNMNILSRDFFQIDALDLAPRLLGKFLRRDDVVLQITEVISWFPDINNAL